MDKNRNEVIFKINEFAILQFLLRFLMIAWIVFSVFKWNINPTFFSLTIVVALFFICTTTETSFILKEKELIVKKSCWLWVLNKSSIIKLDEIKELEIDRGELDKAALILNLIEYIPGTAKKDDKLIITLDDNTIKEYACIGFDRENKKLVDLIKKIKQEAY